MLQNLKQIEGRALDARDGTIGEVKDVYFDDHHWHVRYLVVKTGSWLNQRRVLISPLAVSGVDWSQRAFPVNLTQEQVRNSPPVDADKPVSRQREEELRLYYGWAPYWAPGMIEGGVVPPLPPGDTMETAYSDGQAPLARRGDPHLRSANDTRSYHVAAIDGEIGHVEDFLFDDALWRLRYLIVDTKNWLPGKKVLVSPDWITKVSWSTRRVSVGLSRHAIEASPEYDPAAPWSIADSARLHAHYGRPVSSDWDRDITAGAPPSHRVD